ncbi:MAG TPA: PAS domain-containing protein [Burkholderiaceae bacterium]
MTEAPNSLAFLINGGATAERIATYDWSTHPLGPIAGWPASLRTALSIALNSGIPTYLAWGPEMFSFYNDAYLPQLGVKVDTALGRPFADLWAESWHLVGPIAQRAYSGESTYYEDLPIENARSGRAEMTYFTFSYSPVRDELGKVRGIMCTVFETTDKVLALARSKESEQRLHLSLEASGNIGTWSYDFEHNATWVDERFARLFQVEAALASSGTELERFTNMIHDEDRARVLRAIADAIADVAVYDCEYRIPQRSGEDIWVAARGRIFTDSMSGKRRFAGVAVDITQRKKTEQALLDSERRASLAAESARIGEQRIDALLEAAPVGIVYADIRGEILLANVENKRIWGEHPYSGNVDEYAEWKGWWADGSARHGKRVQAHEWPLSRALAGESVASDVIEIEPFGMPGVRRTLLLRATPVRDAERKIVGGVVANLDLTERIRAEQALQDSEAKFRTITDAMPQMVWSATPEAGNDYVNQRWLEYTGATGDELGGHNWGKLIHADDLPQLTLAWQHSAATGDKFEVEHRLRHVSGEYRWVLNRALPVLDESGAAHRWMGTLTDIHDQKIGAEELRAASRRKDEFLAMLAHELRNPLAPISTAAQILKMMPGDEKRVRQSSEVIARQVTHMTELVDDLLDVSRVTRGLAELEKQTVDLKSLVSSAIEQARPLIEARGHALHLQMDSSAAYVDGDRTRLIQVVANLLNNAAKYTPQGGRIALSVKVTAADAHVSVQDSGIGIDKALLPHVFELFTQAERTPDRAQGGLGLGLALVKSLVALHGGTVEADSAGTGQGSTFTVALPLVHNAPTRSAAGPKVTARADSMPMLIVDDNVDAAESLAALLEAGGHSVAVATHPQQALELAATAPPRLYILDIGLPDMDGYELARRLRAQDPDSGATFIALTGYGQAHDKVLAKAAGFDHHFVKPMDMPRLYAILDSLGPAPMA